MRLLLAHVWLGVAAGVVGAVSIGAQPAPAVDATRVRDLLVLVAAPDRQGALEAAAELGRMGPAVAPTLVEALEKHHSCRVQWVVSGVLQQLHVEPALVETTRLEMARGGCPVGSQADLDLQQEAAFAIIERPRGIAAMTQLLRTAEPLARRRAAFALVAVTERLQPKHPRIIAATPEILAATEAALRPLRDAAVSRAPEPIRCAAFQAIDQARRLPQAGLRSRANALLQDAQVDCGGRRPGTSEPATPQAGETRTVPTDRLIASLDTQSPEAAARTSAALVAAAGEDVVPLLRTRLRETNRCRGLALVAGVLAARNVEEVDVEQAFVRVAGGRCEGREPFDLALAQSAANALLVRAEGVTRLTGWLADHDVAVRRRAAGALSTLFERLGMGEASRPGADAALLAAAARALPPLVTFAQRERDMTARCEAVRAVRRAQEARDEGLRAEAVAQSQGRTLRCQAPPRP